jgi:hypothetical protein
VTSAAPARAARALVVRVREVPVYDPAWPGHYTERAQRQAQLAVARAVEDGRLADPLEEPCLWCGARYPSTLVEYHHACGYAWAHRFGVIALCRRCHRRLHVRLEQPVGWRRVVVSGPVPPV